MKLGAVPALVALMSASHPDGQYSAATALFNIAGGGRDARGAIVNAGSVPALAGLLGNDSWCALFPNPLTDFTTISEASTRNLPDNDSWCAS